MMEWNVICWTLFVACLLVPLGVIQWIHAQRESQPIRQLNSDFVYVYGVGQIAHAYGPEHIYDLELQQQVFSSIQPPRNGVYGPSPYPPFVALFFVPLTYLSFESAYLVWLGLSLALYICGIGAAALTVFPSERLRRSLTYCFALAFYPFLLDTLLNGQLASLAACAIGAAIYQENRGRFFWSGFVLSLLCYKPTLLLLLIPMLFVTRRLRTVLGFLAGAGLLVLAATLFAGAHIWLLYLQMLRSFGKLTGVSGSSRLEIWKYLDLTSCLTAISDHRSAGVMMLASMAMVAIGIAFAITLWNSGRSGRPAQWLVWATTLTWTLLLNVYIPIYDSVLVTIAIILSIGAFEDMRWQRTRAWTVLLSLLIFAFSWQTESFARVHRIQLLTAILLVLGVLQWISLRRAIGVNRHVPVLGAAGSL